MKSGFQGFSSNSLAAENLGKVVGDFSLHFKTNGSLNSYGGFGTFVGLNPIMVPGYDPQPMLKCRRDIKSNPIQATKLPAACNTAQSSASLAYRR